jgi:hypothetical protein
MEKQRTIQQNKALWTYFELLAQTLNDAGLDMKVVLKPDIEIPWSKQTIHDYLWLPVQEMLKQKKSTTELTTTEINEVWEILNRHLSEKFGLYIAFPSLQTDGEYKDPNN